jgi:hypothetical protein
VKRREFITLLGGAAAAWPLTSHAQERMRRLGVLISPELQRADGAAGEHRRRDRMKPRVSVLAH